MTTYYNYLGQPMAVSADPGANGVHASAAGQTLTAPTGPSALYAYDASGHSFNDDTFVGSSGDNTFYINNVTDVVQVASGLSGVKSIVVWAGGYTLPANVENLTFFGRYNWGAGNDLNNLIIMGGDEEATLDGGKGNDVLVGAVDAGTDFQFEVGGGHDVFYNFNSASTVRISGASFTSFSQIQSAMQQVGSDVVLTIDANDSITFRGATIAQFQPQNFLMPLDHSQLGAMTFDDEFSSLDLWNASTGQGQWQTNFGGDLTKLDAYAITSNDEKQLYTAPNFVGQDGWTLSAYNPFSISGGVLDITAGQFSYADSQHTWGQAYYSGMLNSRGLFMQKYGYFEMRAALPTDLGSWPALWMSQDPYNGAEADLLEHLAMYPDVDFSRANDTGTVTGHTTYIPALSGFHTYGMLWGPTTTTFYIDGMGVMSLPTPATWTKPMYMILDMALGGWGGPIDATALPAQMQVDYIHVYGLSATPVQVEIGTPTYTAAAGVNSVTLIGSGDQTVTANSAGDAIVSNNAGGNHLIGGAGSDTITLGAGGDTATGGGGADSFLVNAIPTTASTITDFGTDDRLDLTGLLSSLSYTGSNPLADGYLKFAADGSGDAQVWAKPNTAGSTWTLVTTLDGVASNALQTQGEVVVDGPGSGTGGGAGGGTGGGGGQGSPPPPTMVIGTAANNYSLTVQGVVRQYTVGAGGSTVLGGPDHVDDALTGIHRIQFVDGYLAYSPTDTAGQVYRLYEATLDRAPDQEGLTNWVNQLNAGASLTNVAAGFVNSTEFQNVYGALDNTHFVTLLYDNVLHRAPDQAGLNNWVGMLTSGQESRAQVVTGFSESQEDINDLSAPVQQGLWVGNADAAEVARLYDTMFSRLPDTSGLANWTQALETGTSLQTVANGFVGSQEFQTVYGALDNTHFVTLLYSNVLHRAPDSAGLTNWVNDLNGGESRAEVAIGFSESPEHIGNTAAHIDSGIWVAG